MKKNKKNKMKQVLRRFYATKYPQLSQSAASHRSDRKAEDQSLLNHLSQSALDTLMPFMLRAEIYITMHLELYPALNTTQPEAILTELSRIERETKGCTVFGDGSFLKIANTQIDRGGEEYGNKMLTLIGQAIVRVDADRYARFRQGDEFVMLHWSTPTDDLLQRITTEQKRLGKRQVLPGLPVGIDFGYARHGEVADTYKRLIEEGWIPPVGRTGSKIFFDVALKIAKVRSDVQKIYNRAYLLLALFRVLSSQDPGRYAELEDKLTRGDRYIKPNASWLTIAEESFPDFLRKLVLEFLAAEEREELFIRVVTEVAESIYEAPLKN